MSPTINATDTVRLGTAPHTQNVVTAHLEDHLLVAGPTGAPAHQILTNYARQAHHAGAQVEVLDYTGQLADRVTDLPTRVGARHVFIGIDDFTDRALSRLEAISTASVDAAYSGPPRLLVLNGLPQMMRRGPHDTDVQDAVDALQALLHISRHTGSTLAADFDLPTAQLVPQFGEDMTVLAQPGTSDSLLQTLGIRPGILSDHPGAAALRPPGAPGRAVILDCP
ncbi:hypothetical protein [Streptomyces xiamenensis]|uniref:hypothetical protein n=1 Tax=Streptomyces xiamenensis TaxID=408015 RepID=UPI0035D8E3F3